MIRSSAAWPFAGRPTASGSTNPRTSPTTGAGRSDRTSWIGGSRRAEDKYLAALINAIARDVPLRLIADKGSLRQGFGYEALVVRKELFDSGAVTTIPDLRGRKIALNSTT